MSVNNVERNLGGYPDIGQPTIEELRKAEGNEEVPPPKPEIPDHNPEGKIGEKKVVHFYEQNWAHSLLLLGTAGLSIACLIPGVRQVSALALRSVALGSSTAMCADSWSKVDVGDRILNIARVGVVALGIIGMAASRPALYVASLAAEVGLQTLEVGKALYEKDAAKALTHFGILAIDTFMLAGVVTGSWPLITTAAALSTAAMTAFVVKAVTDKKKGEDLWATVDAISYITLMVTSYVTCFNVSKHVVHVPKSGTYKVTNDKNTEMKLFDAKGHHVGTLQPGESGTFTARLYSNESSALHGQFTKGDGMMKEELFYTKHKQYTKKIQHPVKPHRVPTKPIGGTIIVDRTQSKAYKEVTNDY